MIFCRFQFISQIFILLLLQQSVFQPTTIANNQKHNQLFVLKYYHQGIQIQSYYETTQNCQLFSQSILTIFKEITLNKSYQQPNNFVNKFVYTLFVYVISQFLKTQLNKILEFRHNIFQYILSIPQMKNTATKILLTLAFAIYSLFIIYSQARFYHQYEEQLFNQWLNKYHIDFSTSQKMYRLVIFTQNVKIINQHNRKQTKSYKMGINQFTSFTNQELVSTYLRDMSVYKHDVFQQKQQFQILDKNIDWVKQGVVTQIKNQGQCGSSWAFGAVGAIQGLNKIAYGQLVNFSIQQMLDCTQAYGNQGCNGGFMDGAYQYIIDKGISLQNQYPYKAVVGTCAKQGGDFKISSFTDVKSCEDLAKQIFKGPISTAVDAQNWFKYEEGVFDECKSLANHGILLVGIIDGNWKLKNTWGSDWGEDGYIRIPGGDNCGICKYPSYPNK